MRTPMHALTPDPGPSRESAAGSRLPITHAGGPRDLRVEGTGWHVVRARVKTATPEGGTTWSEVDAWVYSGDALRPDPR